MTVSRGRLPAAGIVPDRLKAESDAYPAGRGEAQARAIVDRVLKSKGRYGITRLGSVTRLDRIGIPVAQSVRPLSRSNSVSQGKGLTLAQAAASALMENLENWAGEQVGPDDAIVARGDDLGDDIAPLYAAQVCSDAPMAWSTLPTRWVTGFDLAAGRTLPVPLALVDTDYTRRLPDSDVFVRTTTGLGAAISLSEAIVHAGLEILERHAVYQAHLIPHFFDRFRCDPVNVGGDAAELVDRLRRADMVCGLWRVPAPHALPIYWAHVMEGEGAIELAPLPASGFGCDFTHGAAVCKTLLEACQSRLTAISGAREDITRLHYPKTFDREKLDGWRVELAAAVPTTPPAEETACTHSQGDRVSAVVTAMRRAGAAAVVAVPLHLDDERGLAVVRLVAPPLSLVPRP